MLNNSITCIQNNLQVIILSGIYRYVMNRAQTQTVWPVEVEEKVIEFEIIIDFFSCVIGISECSMLYTLSWEMYIYDVLSDNADWLLCVIISWFHWTWVLHDATLVTDHIFFHLNFSPILAASKILTRAITTVILKHFIVRLWYQYCCYNTSHLSIVTWPFPSFLKKKFVLVFLYMNERMCSVTCRYI